VRVRACPGTRVEHAKEARAGRATRPDDPATGLDRARTWVAHGPTRPPPRRFEATWTPASHPGARPPPRIWWFFGTDRFAEGEFFRYEITDLTLIT